MNEQELTKELAEWRGFKWIPQVEGKIWTEHWLCPDGAVYGKLCPDFPNSTDACFKWLVPKVNKLGYLISMGQNSNGDYTVYLAFSYELQNIPLHSKAGTLAMAVCLAVEKLIDASIPAEVNR